MYQRVLIKISGEALSSPSTPLCRDTIRLTAQMLSDVQSKGVQIGVVVGGGNILRGRDSGSMERNRADSMGMLATAINALALQDALLAIGAPCTVYSAIEMNRICNFFTARDADACLNSGKIAIFACGTGLPFFSTDTGAAVRAAEIHADVLLLAKNVDAVYSADPKKDPTAVKYAHLSYDEVIRNDLQATDLTAITLCREQGIKIHVFALKELIGIFEGSQAGTVID